MLGPIERPVANYYRAIFFDIGHLAREVGAWVPAERILEIGCGEGSLTERLSKVYPAARITGIDITPRVGRLFRGDRERVTFIQQTTQDFAVANAASFDLVLICDVIHHVPWDIHKEFLTDARRAVRPGGRLVLKDWERRTNIAHLLCYLSDRYVTGDRIRYASADELRELLRSVFGQFNIEREFRIPPLSNNIAFFINI
jgi:2-polyprenyl-6-hydroxyphenyl methylase/3-demethylubiquinone-9 3-methyltransferase